MMSETNGAKIDWKKSFYAEANKVADLERALLDIEQMSRSAARGPAHVAKITLGLMADVAKRARSAVGAA
jgi:hypothetical protein